MRRGRAQYSLEFLVTYGWALLIIGVLVGVIYTFGWFDPGEFLPQKCQFYGQVGCRDFYASTDSVNLSLINNFGTGLVVKGMRLYIDGEEVAAQNWSYPGVKDWVRGGVVSIGLNVSNVTKIFPGDRLDATTVVHYFSNQTCSSCWNDSLGSATCTYDCVHNATGKLLVKVARR